MLTCLSPVHQLVRNGIHRIAAEDEVAGLVEDGWSQDQIEFYAIWGDPVQIAGGAHGTPATRAYRRHEVQCRRHPRHPERVGRQQHRFANRVSWLVNNKSQLDLRYALQIGDLTNWGNVDPAQFTKLGIGAEAPGGGGPLGRCDRQPRHGSSLRRWLSLPGRQRSRRFA